MALQKDAVQALARVDPDRALELLAGMDTPVPMQSGSLPEDLRAYAARTVFPAYWRRHGEKALDRIRQNAQRIGATGQYPFRAMAPILLDIGKRDSVAADELFGEALGYYSQGSVVQDSDRVFVDFLDAVWRVISPSLQRRALLVVVPELLHSSQPKGVSYRAQIYTDRGIAELKSPSSELLYRLLPKVREIDPEWAKRLEDQLPGLRQAGGSSGHTKMAAEATVVNTSNASPERIAVLQEHLLQGQRADEARNLARTDPEGALELSLSDPEFRAEALASVAEALSEKGQDPERVRDLVRQAKDNTDRITDKAAKVEVFSSLAAAAAAAGGYDDCT